MVTTIFNEFSDVESFSRAACPLLQQNLTLNTVCLSEIPLIRDNSAGVYLAIITCKECNNEHSCVALSAGNTSMTYKLMISEGVCQHMAGDIAQHLQQQACGFTSLTAVEQVAELLADELGFTSKHVSDIMVLSSVSTADTNGSISVEPPHAAAASIDGPGHCSSAQQAGTAPSTEQPTTADMGTNGHAASAGSAGPEDLTIKPLSKHSTPDVDLIFNWSTNFVQAEMKSDTPPPKSMIDSLVRPWLDYGQYELALDANGETVCMLSHVPTSDVSCRIVWVYTPPEHRQKGYARRAVAELCKLLKQKYQHICLLVNQDNHTARRVYQENGFVTVDALVLACLPSHPFGYALPQQRNPVTEAAAD